VLIDTHCHIASRQFDNDREAVLRHAKDCGVQRVIAPATDLDDCAKLAAICEAHDEVFMASGIHPCDAHTVSGDEWTGRLREFAMMPKVVAIGEIGLDYFHPPPDGFDAATWKKHQAEVLARQLELAVELGLNVILHNRESWDDLIALVTPFSGRLRAVLHCYTGTVEQARPLLDAGHLLSFTGIVTFKNAEVVRQTARDVPDGAYMLETDSPYLAPVPHRGKRCEPAHVADTARAVAALRGVDFDQIIASTAEAARDFFRLPAADE